MFVYYFIGFYLIIIPHGIIYKILRDREESSEKKREDFNDGRKKRNTKEDR
jgi:hypothetical protein